eukprot:COSAG02_NODE_4223_length_5615_cov_2.992386_8_plen_410_part_00
MSSFAATVDIHVFKNDPPWDDGRRPHARLIYTCTVRCIVHRPIGDRAGVGRGRCCCVSRLARALLRPGPGPRQGSVASLSPLGLARCTAGAQHTATMMRVHVVALLLLVLFTVTESRSSSCGGVFPVLGALSCIWHAAADEASPDRFEYIDNGVIRVGVDTARGGVIGYLAPSDNSVANVINTGDMGREVQLAFYAEPAFYNPPTAEYPKGACNKTNLGRYVYTKFGRDARPWAPIGAGDTDGNRATILSQSRDETTLNLTSRPLQWPCHNVSCECTFEKRMSVGSVRADGLRVDATLRTFRTDAFTPKPWPQEIPAVYSNAAYHRLVTYNGSLPYTQAPLSVYNNTGDPSIRDRHPGPFPATEHWAAYVNEEGKKNGTFVRVYIQMVVISRQARDKHRKNSKTVLFFL